MNFKGAIFDVDGTLLDSMPMWSNVARNYLIDSGYKPKEDLIEKIRALSLLQAARYFISDYKVNKTEDEIMSEINRSIEKFYFYDAKAKDGVIELLEKLRNSNVEMCVATATDRYMVEAALKRLKILDYFSGVFTCTEVGKGKDEPLIYELAAKKMKLENKDVVVFEDALYAVTTAKNAGFQVIGVYDEFETCNQNSVRRLSDHYIKSMKELI